MITSIREFIREIVVEQGKRTFIIYHFGKVGKLVKDILNTEYDIHKVMIMDDQIKEPGIFPCEYLANADVPDDRYIIISTVNEYLCNMEQSKSFSLTK